ncbi:hypothetical protein ColKHC_10810 [Colletotrichum higginsianum]|nr:hypothetical protein ColKHC_10810 [Colletotrichum higginsianum]
MTTSATTLLPRFLLPALSPMWRAAATPTARPAAAAIRRTAVWTIRYASSKPTRAGQKGPLILEKPAKFNPPSHGSRLPNKNVPKHYGGPLSGQEARAQRTREYPGTMAPRAPPPPPASEFWSSPVAFIRTWVHVLQLHERDRNEKAIAMHTRHTDDVAKRQLYRKVHGLDKENPIANFLGMKEESEEEKEAATAAAAIEASPVAGSADVVTGAEEKKRKWLGVF